MKKTLFIILVTVTFGFCLAAPSARAGNVQRNRWEGVAIGIGAAMLGHVLYKNHVQEHPAREVVYVNPRPQRHKFRPPRKARGHWEVRKTWVLPAYESVWNPGHYSRRGRWVEGQWIEIEKAPGYWTEERVWVSKKYRHRKRHHDYD